MKFSNTTLKNGILQRIEDHTQLGDGVITGDETLKKKMTSNVNETIYELTTDIMLLQDGFDWDDASLTDFPIATTPLVANQRDYKFIGIDFLKLKRVDVTYDGTNWVRATPFDSSAYFDKPGFGSDSVDVNFLKTAPMYDPKGSGFWLYPLASASDVAAGAKARIEYSRAFDEFTYDDIDKEPPIDRNFHDLVAIGASLKWPGLPDKQYQKLTKLYGERLIDGAGNIKLSGGRALMVASYSRRNEDSFLVFGSANLIEDYK